MPYGLRAIALAVFSAASLALVVMTPAVAQDVKQIKLNEAQIKGFIASQKDLAAIAGKIQTAGDKPDAALQGELDGIAKKHGFANFTELDEVAANISIVMAGLDPQTGAFTDPVEALKKELVDVKADNTIPEADKKQLIAELEDAIKSTPSVQNKENIDLVKAHRADIEKSLQ